MKPRACMLITDINTMISRSETHQSLVIPVSFCWVFEKSMYGPLKYMYRTLQLSSWACRIMTRAIAQQLPSRSRVGAS